MILIEIDTFNDEEVFELIQAMYSHFMYNNKSSLYLGPYDSRISNIFVKNLFEQTHAYKFFRI